MTHVERNGSRSTSQRSRCQTVRIHAAALASLPPPGEEWEYADVDIDKSVYKRFQHRNIVRETERYCGGVASVWTVDGDAYAEAQRIVDNPGRLSCCGASGITNDGGDIRCKRCGEPVPDDEVERVFAK